FPSLHLGADAIFEEALSQDPRLSGGPCRSASAGNLAVLMGADDNGQTDVPLLPRDEVDTSVPAALLLSEMSRLHLGGPTASIHSETSSPRSEVSNVEGDEVKKKRKKHTRRGTERAPM